ncbi:hypothetical protein FRB93_008454 [Tulasnella sp. JGI-2019a]|nr:hypothetical protein FRB93_008454 [Tulasnella sp. JGI-2019a]
MFTMPKMSAALVAALSFAPIRTLAHLCPYHPSMHGFNVTSQTFSYDNRPMTPLMDLTFDKWWFHGHMDYPPNDGDVFEFPAGGSAMMEIACNKGLTSYWRTSEGTTDIRQADGFPCPGPGQGYGPGLSQSSLHTNGFADVGGTAIAIVDKMDAKSIQPEDFVVFTVNQTSPWITETYYQVPAQMPACTGAYCYCAWFWVHNDDSGSEQNYMNAFRCKITNVSSQAKAIATPAVPRYCPTDPKNCTQGAQNPFYWYQAERNNMPNGQYDPPTYQSKYGFANGAQQNIFLGSAGATAVSGSTSTTTSFVATTTPTTAASGATSTTVTNTAGSSTTTATSGSGSGSGSTGSNGSAPAAAAAQSSQSATTVPASSSTAKPASGTPVAAASSANTSTNQLTKQCKRRVKGMHKKRRGLLNHTPAH